MLFAFVILPLCRKNTVWIVIAADAVLDSVHILNLARNCPGPVILDE
jgi:hypothetical protein